MLSQREYHEFIYLICCLFDAGINVRQKVFVILIFKNITQFSHNASVFVQERSPNNVENNEV